MLDVRLATDKILDAKEKLDSAIYGSDPAEDRMSEANGLIDEALTALNYKDPKSYQDGEYVIYHEQYAKRVDATFGEDGELLTLVDKDGNDWRQWAVSHGVFDPERTNCYMKTVEEARQDG